MTREDVSRILHERGVQELAGPTIARYLSSELSLDVAARPLANIVMAVVRWRAPSRRPRVEVMAPEELVRLYPPLRHDAGSLPAGGVAPALVLRRGVERSPSGRNADTNAVYDQAVHLNACYNVMKEFARRRVRAHRLYARVARLVGRAGADAA